MKLVLTSDTHDMQHSDLILPEGDVLIHAGDLALSGVKEEIQRTLDWLNKQPHEHVICIAGNHDWAIQKNECISFGRIQYLEDQSVKIDGVKFHGSPWQPEFMGWAFNLQRNELKAKWDNIEADVDVLITHSPPAGIMDKVRPFPPKYPLKYAGCDYLLAKVLAVKPKIHVFGHIHSGYGKKQIGETTFVNAAMCDEAYCPINAPFEIEI